jgi:multidrug efflux pump subunit AcrA (membrane-fusion protein)
MFGHLRLIGSAPYDAFLVPDEAITSDQNKQIVYVVDSQDVVHEQRIEPGPMVNGLRVIKAGLKPTDRVVIEGIQRARPDSKVKAVIGRIVLKPENPAANGLAAGPPPAASATVSDGR